VTTYRLLLDLDHGKHTTEQTLAAACIHRDSDMVRFYDADHQLVYAVQCGLLLAIESVEDQDQAAEPDVDLFAVLRARAAHEHGWTDEQAAEVPDWLVEQLVDHLC
jgi:hypothetical protein